MKPFPLAAAVLFILSTSLNAQSIRLLDIVQKPSPNVAVDASINERGGYIAFNRDYQPGCTGGYQVKVTFSKSLNMLQPGESFQVTLLCEQCNTPCNKKWRIVDVLAANNVTAIDQYPNYEKNENIEYVSSTNGTGLVSNWKGDDRSTIVTLKYNPKKSVPLTAIKIVAAGDHEVIIVFSTGNDQGPPPPGGKPDLSCAWESSYGNIYWTEGYYQTTSKTLSGELYQKDGVWVYEGTWGRTSSSRWGKVFFQFTSANEFTGYWTEKDGSKKTEWTGKGECLLIKY